MQSILFSWPLSHHKKTVFCTEVGIKVRFLVGVLFPYPHFIPFLSTGDGNSVQHCAATKTAVWKAHFVSGELHVKWKALGLVHTCMHSPRFPINLDLSWACESSPLKECLPLRWPQVRTMKKYWSLLGDGTFRCPKSSNDGYACMYCPLFPLALASWERMQGSHSASL